MAKKWINLNIRLETADHEKLCAAAVDAGLTPTQLGRMAIQFYVDGYRGPYVLKVPIDGQAVIR